MAWGDGCRRSLYMAETLQHSFYLFVHIFCAQYFFIRLLLRRMQAFVSVSGFIEVLIEVLMALTR